MNIFGLYYAKSRILNSVSPSGNLFNWQITGRILAVKKALIAVSHCLQDCPPLDKVAAPLNTPTLSPPNMAPHYPQSKLFPHLNPRLPPVRFPYDPSKQTTQANEESRHDSKGTELEVVFRLLCSNNTAGSVIGKKGAIVRDLESKTGASIIFAPPLSKFAERIVTISAVEVSHVRKVPCINDSWS